MSAKIETGIQPRDAVYLRMKNKNPFLWRETYERDKTVILNSKEYQFTIYAGINCNNILCNL